MSPIVQTLQWVLPHDIIEDIILPDLLTQHLHVLLVGPDPPDWHAFYVLPLVCPFFYDTCQNLFSKIFGVKRRPGLRDIRSPEDDQIDPDDFDPSPVLDYAIIVSERARRPVSQVAQLHTHDRTTLLADNSLLRVYTCLALGKMFLNTDVLLPLRAVNGGGVARSRRNPWDEDHEDDEPQGPSVMNEANIHRAFMPIECAQRICDVIAPQRLALVAAEYMARVLPVYHTLPLLAKRAHDLRFNVARDYKLGLGMQEDYAAWALHTLRRLEDAEDLLEDMMKSGALVRSFWVGNGIPAEALKLTGIICALDDVVRAEWGPQTADTRRKASALIRRWTADTLAIEASHP